jgi:hypothetical protein
MIGGSAGGGGNRLLGHGAESPVGFVGGALLDPTFEQRAFRGLERRAMGVGRRHDFVLVAARDPPPQFRLLKTARHHRAYALALGVGCFRQIKPAACLPAFLVGAVAREAVGGKDWPNVAVERDRFRQGETAGQESSRARGG